MSGRRSHVRFAVVRSPEGVLRVMRDVVVQRDADADAELIAISREPGVLGEAILVAFPADEGRLPFRVAESQPIVTNGTVRHRLRLQAIGAQPDTSTNAPPPRGSIRS